MPTVPLEQSIDQVLPRERRFDRIDSDNLQLLVEVVHAATRLRPAQSTDHRIPDVAIGNDEGQVSSASPRLGWPVGLPRPFWERRSSDPFVELDMLLLILTAPDDRHHGGIISENVTRCVANGPHGLVLR